MVITYVAQGFVKIQFGSTVIAVNPVDKKVMPEAPRFGSSLVLVSLKDPYCSGIETVSYGEKRPFVIDGPGEYEVGGLYIKGLKTITREGKINTVYSLLLEQVNVCNLGLLDTPVLDEEVQEELGDIDVLFLPVGDRVLSPAAASKVAAILEPKLVIPLGFGEKKEVAKHLTSFLKEEGIKDIKPLDKLTLKRRDLEGKEGEVMLLQP